MTALLIANVTLFAFLWHIWSTKGWVNLFLKMALLAVGVANGYFLFTSHL